MRSISRLLIVLGICCVNCTNDAFRRVFRMPLSLRPRYSLAAPPYTLAVLRLSGGSVSNFDAHEVTRSEACSTAEDQHTCAPSIYTQTLSSAAAHKERALMDLKLMVGRLDMAEQMATAEGSTKKKGLPEAKSESFTSSHRDGEAAKNPADVQNACTTNFAGSKRGETTLPADTAAASTDVERPGCLPHLPSPLTLVLVSVGESYLAVVGMMRRSVIRAAGWIKVYAVRICLRYNLLQRMPMLVNFLRVVYEVAAICADAFHQYALFRRVETDTWAHTSLDGGWAHDAEYSFWHATHKRDVLGYAATSAKSNCDTAMRSHADVGQDVQYHDSVGSQEDEDTASHVEQDEKEYLNTPSLPHTNLLSLGAKLIARNCDVATALAVRDAMHHRLQAHPNITPSSFQQELSAVVSNILSDNILSDSAAHTRQAGVGGERGGQAGMGGEAGIGGERLRQAIRQCRSNYPGAFMITMVGSKASGKTRCALKLARELQTPRRKHAHADAGEGGGHDAFAVAIATAEASPSARVYLERLAHQHNVTCFAKSSDETATLLQNNLLQSSCVSAVREAAARAGTDVVIVDSPPLSLALHAHANSLVAPFLCESDLILFVVDAQQGLGAADELEQLQSIVDALQAGGGGEGEGEGGGMPVDCREDSQAAEGNDWQEIRITLPKEAAEDLLGASSSLLRNAMRNARTVISLELQQCEGGVSRSGEEVGGKAIAGGLVVSGMQCEGAGPLTPRCPVYELVIQGTLEGIDKTHEYLGVWSAVCRELIAAEVSRVVRLSSSSRPLPSHDKHAPQIGQAPTPLVPDVTEACAQVRDGMAEALQPLQPKDMAPIAHSSRTSYTNCESNGMRSGEGARAVRGSRGIICSKTDLVAHPLGPMMSMTHATRLPILWMSCGERACDLKPVPPASTLVASIFQRT